MMTLNDMAAVFSAASEGKEIQWAPDLKGPWEFIDNSPRVLVKAAAEGNFLRVKPVAREWWLIVNPEGKTVGFTEGMSSASLLSCPKQGPIHVREVID